MNNKLYVLAKEYFNLVFVEKKISEIDNYCIDNICNISSLYSSVGIKDLKKNIQNFCNTYPTAKIIEQDWSFLDDSVLCKWKREINSNVYNGSSSFQFLFNKIALTINTYDIGVISLNK